MPDAHDIEKVSIQAFGHKFEDLLPGNAEDLRTLETEGAIYAEFADLDANGKVKSWKDKKGNELATFSRYRVPLTPSEMFEYVEAHIAQQQFFAELNRTDDFTAAVLAIQNEKFRKRIAEYGNYGKLRLADGSMDDIRGCTASFLGEHLESLVCGNIRERYEPIPRLGSRSNQDELVLNALKSVAVSARRLASRQQGRPAFIVENEYDVQDLTETSLRSIYDDLVREEWTPKRAGSAKRIDLVIPSTGVVIECKFVRKSNVKRIADELRIDFECYHDYPGCRRLYALVYDPERLIDDPELFSRDLDGLRRKKNHEFVVSVLVA